MSSKRFSRSTARPARPGTAIQPRRSDGLTVLLARADVDDPIGREALERAHRHTVVAELGVVVVLDDHHLGGPPSR